MGRKASICSHLCKIVECAYELTAYLELIDVAMRTVVVRSDIENCPIDCIPMIASVSMNLMIEVAHLHQHPDFDTASSGRALSKAFEKCFATCRKSSTHECVTPNYV